MTGTPRSEATSTELNIKSNSNLSTPKAAAAAPSMPTSRPSTPTAAALVINEAPRQQQPQANVSATAQPTSNTSAANSNETKTVLIGPNGEQYQPREIHHWFWTKLAGGTSAAQIEQTVKKRAEHVISSSSDSSSDSSRNQSPAARR